MSQTNALDRAAIAALVIANLKEVLDNRGAAAHEPIEEATRLIGPEAVLDSLGLVTFAIGLEHGLEDRYGVSLVLADEQELVRKNSPFHSLGALIDHILSAVADP